MVEQFNLCIRDYSRTWNEALRSLPLLPALSSDLQMLVSLFVTLDDSLNSMTPAVAIIC